MGRGARPASACDCLRLPASACVSRVCPPSWPPALTHPIAIGIVRRRAQIHIISKKTHPTSADVKAQLNESLREVEAEQRAGGTTKHALVIDGEPIAPPLPLPSSTPLARKTLPRPAPRTHAPTAPVSHSPSPLTLTPLPARVLDTGAGESLEVVMKQAADGSLVGEQLPFLRFTQHCTSVVCCRCAPTQKAQVMMHPVPPSHPPPSPFPLPPPPASVSFRSSRSYATLSRAPSRSPSATAPTTCR